MSNAMQFAGKRVMITGGADGLGLEMARSFGREGARLFLLDVDAGKAERAADGLRSSGVDVACHLGSVADASAVESAFEAMDAAMGGIDILINNAGIAAHKPSVDLSDAEWTNVMAVNVNGAMFCARAAGRRMLAQESGSIVNMSSIYGVVAGPERLAYCVSKAAVAMMARALAVEWAGRGVRVNAIAPAYVHTELVEDHIRHKRIDLEAVKRRTPMNRLGTTSEIAETALFLCSPAATYITGQVIGVDGGWTAYGYV